MGVQLPPHVRTFCWHLCKGLLATKDNLVRRGMNLPLQCPVCDCDNETILHLFRECCWVVFLGRALHLDSVVDDLSNNLFDWLNSVFTALSGEKLCLFALTAFWIWSNLNRTIFYAVCARPGMVVYSVTYWLANLRTLDQLCAVTFDGVQTSNRYGLIARDKDGRVLEVESGRIGEVEVEDALHAQASATLFAMNKINRLPGQKFIIEGDCQVLIQELQKQDRSLMSCGLLINDMKDETSCLSFLHFSFISCNGNKVANYLAHLPFNFSIIAFLCFYSP
ncbi:uncharacterized protein [Rutidosis leptorrhynchoides]|uniref:uncharacterized protein n=1 Tax=Rutidosis leptorrhynchoides TaxID=125765 RepID=UPI003A9A61D3